jgi:hypothetical protein
MLDLVCDLERLLHRSCDERHHQSAEQPAIAAPV